MSGDEPAMVHIMEQATLTEIVVPLGQERPEAALLRIVAQHLRDSDERLLVHSISAGYESEPEPRLRAVIVTGVLG